MCVSSINPHTHTQTDTDTQTPTDTDTDRHRQTQTDTDRHRQTQTHRHRHRQEPTQITSSTCLHGIQISFSFQEVASTTTTAKRSLGRWATATVAAASSSCPHGPKRSRRVRPCPCSITNKASKQRQQIPPPQKKNTRAWLDLCTPF